MRPFARRAVLIALGVILTVVLVVPASAGQIITYEGQTSAPSSDRVTAVVFKRNSGRRFLRSIVIRTTLICEDAATQRFKVIFGGGPLQDDGSFEREVSNAGRTRFWRDDGSIGFRNGEGTSLFNTAKLTEDGTESQLCTTGKLSWTVERTRPTAANMPDGTGFMR